MTSKQREDTRREAKLLATLRHPYIIRYRESFLTDGKTVLVEHSASGGGSMGVMGNGGNGDTNQLSIVMDFAQGGDLYTKIRKGI
jgi:serine/threonine protein kinase